MYRTKEGTQKRKDMKKQMILDTAAKLFSTKGYHNTAVKNIVNEADVSVGSFYFYYKSKEDLFIELYKHIVKEFDDITTSVVDVENFPILKNYTRVMMATLWMYEQNRELARIMLLDATVMDPSFQQLERDRMKDFAAIMTEWFRRFKLHKEVRIPDERIAALVYAGSYYCLINEWLASDSHTSLVQYGYAFCVYNLQALRIPFDENVVKAYIEEVLKELDQRKK
jgi:AcrR family transcriptional regulator